MGVVTVQMPCGVPIGEELRIALPCEGLEDGGALDGAAPGPEMDDTVTLEHVRVAVAVRTVVATLGTAGVAELHPALQHLTQSGVSPPGVVDEDIVTLDGELADPRIGMEPRDVASVLDTDRARRERRGHRGKIA